jgi:hypothetical protein
MTVVGTCLVGLLTITSFLPVFQSKPPSAGLPPFRVVGHDATALSIVVDPSTPVPQLTALINAFRTARAKGALGTLIPPTTPKGNKGPYAVVVVFVMSDAQWATTQRLHAFTNPTSSGISAAEKEFGKRILGYYFYTSLGNGEEGSLGYDGDGLRTANYKKLF